MITRASCSFDTDGAKARVHTVRRASAGTVSPWTLAAKAAAAIALPGLVIALPALVFAATGRTAPQPSARPAREVPSDAPAPLPSAGIVRDGRYWVETANGFLSIEPGGKLQVSTIGEVHVEGDAGDGVRYTVIKRVQAASEAEARRRLELFKLESGRIRDVVTIKLVHAGADGQSAMLRISVPRSLRFVDLQTHGGSVDASGLSGDVSAQSGGGTVSLDRISGDVTARTAGGEIVLGTIGGSIRGVTAGGSISARSIGKDAALETGGGDIHASDVRGSIRASTAGGSVKIGRSGGSVVASTAGGPIEVEQAAGMVSANSLGGPVRVGSANGVQVESAGGTIRLNDVYGPLRASTAVGDIYARLMAGRAAGESMLATGGGDITIVIPPNFAVTIRAENGSPETVRGIITEFPGIQVRTLGSMTVAEGKLHGGGPLLRLTSTRGTIKIVQSGSKLDVPQEPAEGGKDPR